MSGPTLPTVQERASPPAAIRHPGMRAIAAAGCAALIGATAFIYQQAVLSYFFNDDFQWLQAARQFEAANPLRIAQYTHFYRPIIEIYFFAGDRSFGCDPLLFHLASLSVHLLNVFLLFLVVRALTGESWRGFLAALFFSVQPGFVEAVAWVSAISDLMAAFWYLLALLLHLRFLQTRSARFYWLSMGAFTICLLTHESSATLLPMMIALDALVASQDPPRTPVSFRSRLWEYAPFAVLLVGYLGLEFVVSNRSYLVTEGHYAFGWHAVPHVVQYVIALLVWKRMLASYVLIPVVLAVLLARGTPRVRFAVLWILVTLAPASFFTWGNASRYLYLPAAGFALLLAELTRALEGLAAAMTSARAARAFAVVLAAALAARFGVFARKGSADFRERTRPYERLVEAVRRANPSGPPGGVAYLDRMSADTVPEMYLAPAVQTAYCRSDVRVIVR